MGRTGQDFRATKACSVAAGRRRGALWFIVASLLISGCSAVPNSSSCPAPTVPGAVQCFATSPANCACPDEFIVPFSVTLADSVSEDEAIATAMANNAHVPGHAHANGYGSKAMSFRPGCSRIQTSRRLFPLA